MLTFMTPSHYSIKILNEVSGTDRYTLDGTTLVTLQTCCGRNTSTTNKPDQFSEFIVVIYSFII